MRGGRLHQLAAGDIAVDAQNGRLFFIVDQRRIDFQEHFTAVLAEMDGLEIVEYFFLQNYFDACFASADIFADLFQRHADHFPALEAVQFAGTVVHVQDDFVLHGEDDDGIVGVLEQLAVVLFRLPQRFFEKHALADIDQDAVVVKHPAVGAFHGPGIVPDPDGPSVADTEFEFAEGGQRGGQLPHMVPTRLLFNVEIVDIHMPQVGNPLEAKDIRQRLVGFDDAAFGGGAVDSDRQVLQQVLVA